MSPAGCWGAEGAGFPTRDHVFMGTLCCLNPSSCISPRVMPFHQKMAAKSYEL